MNSLQFMTQFVVLFNFFFVRSPHEHWFTDPEEGLVTMFVTLTFWSQWDWLLLDLSWVHHFLSLRNLELEFRALYRASLYLFCADKITYWSWGPLSSAPIGPQHWRNVGWVKWGWEVRKREKEAERNRDEEQRYSVFWVPSHFCLPDPVSFWGLPALWVIKVSSSDAGQRKHSQAKPWYFWFFSSHLTFLWPLCWWVLAWLFILNKIPHHL